MKVAPMKQNEKADRSHYPFGFDPALPITLFLSVKLWKPALREVTGYANSKNVK